MTKTLIWSSGVGLGALLFYIAGAVGGFLSGYFFWLPFYQSLSGQEEEVFALIMMIVMFAVAFFAVLAIILSIFGIPKALWIIFTIISLACAITPAIVITVAFEGYFVYTDLSWYQNFMYDFIGVWMAVGGSLFALVLGIFVPKKY